MRSAEWKIMEVDLSRLPAAVQKAMDNIFRKDADLKILKAIQRQTHIAKLMRLNPHRWKDDFGPQQLIVDPVIDDFFTAQYGPAWKEDKNLVKWLLGRNPEMAGQSVAGRTRVGYTKQMGDGRSKMGKQSGVTFGRGTMEFAT